MVMPRSMMGSRIDSIGVCLYPRARYVASGVSGGSSTRIVQATKERSSMIRVHHDLGYTVPSTKGGTDHVTVSRSPNSYHRLVRFGELDRRRVCGAGATL